MDHHVGIHRDGHFWRYDHSIVALRDPRNIAWWSAASKRWYEGGTTNLYPSLHGLYGDPSEWHDYDDLLRPSTFRSNPFDTSEPAQRAAKNQE